MARFYPGCRQCPHRGDTGTLSGKQVEQLAETRPRGLVQPLFHDEGAAGVYLNDLTPATAREMAAALGISLQRSTGTEDVARRQIPTVVIAGDGRPMSSPLLAAVAEGLRFAGCNVVDIGPATSSCVAFAIDQLGTLDTLKGSVPFSLRENWDSLCTLKGTVPFSLCENWDSPQGGVLVGNCREQSHAVGLKFWAAGPRPVSAGERLDALRQQYHAGVDRPSRAYGSLRRFQAGVAYLAAMAEHYHGLRPLRVVLATSSKPTAEYLGKLTDQLACRIIPARTNPERLPGQVPADEAHLAAIIDDDGETCRVLDETGRPVASRRLLVLIARHLVHENSIATVVLEEGTSPACVEAMRAMGLRVVDSDARRANMEQAIRRQEATFGGGRSGRFWYTHTGIPLPDGLMTLTLLLVILSQSDRRLSEVLDREAVVE